MKPNNEHTSPRVISGSRSQCLRTKWGHSLVCPFISCSTLHQHDENDLTSSSFEFFNICPPSTFPGDIYTQKLLKFIHFARHHSFREVDLYMQISRREALSFIEHQRWIYISLVESCLLLWKCLLCAVERVKRYANILSPWKNAGGNFSSFHCWVWDELNRGKTI